MKVTAASQLPGLVHDSSASGSTVFIEPKAVITLGNQIRELEGRERQEEWRVLSSLSALVAEEVPALEELHRVLVALDVALARARYGRWLGAVRPELSADPQAPVLLRDLRHPLLLWQEHRGGEARVVPVTVSVSAELRVVAITGPNTGGKTVTLKSVGLAALMARAGLFLPCSGTPQLPWCSLVLADIGDEQSLQQNLSTFSGHVRRIARILEALDAPRRRLEPLWCFWMRWGPAPIPPKAQPWLSPCCATWRSGPDSPSPPPTSVNSRRSSTPTVASRTPQWPLTATPSPPRITCNGASPAVATPWRLPSGWGWIRR